MARVLVVVSGVALLPLRVTVASDRVLGRLDQALS